MLFHGFFQLLREVEPMDLLIQIIGAVGLIFNIITFQCKKHRNVMIFKSANELTFAIQYYLLGAYTGTAVNGLSTVRNMLFAILIEKKKSTRPVQIVFILFYIVFGVFTWQGPISLLVIFAKIVTTAAYGIRDTAKVRLLTFPTSICWIVYNGVCGSLFGVICEIFTLASITIGMLRIDLPEYRKKKSVGTSCGKE